MAPPPLVVAHRGSSAAHAEHTLAAYELALEQSLRMHARPYVAR